MAGKMGIFCWNAQRCGLLCPLYARNNVWSSRHQPSCHHQFKSTHFLVSVVYRRFQCYVHRSYLKSFDFHLSTWSFDALFGITQSQTVQTSIYFVQLLWKWATSSKGHARGLWLVDFNPSCLLTMSKDGCQKITAITRYACNSERGCKCCHICT